MKNRADYSKYKCPYSHIEKDCGHELHGPEGYEKTYGIWCACGFRGPVFCLEPDELKLKKSKGADMTKKEARQTWCPMIRVPGEYGPNNISENSGPYGEINKWHCCKADLCMMWREDGTKRGYCGLAGPLL